MTTEYQMKHTTAPVTGMKTFHQWCPNVDRNVTYDRMSELVSVSLPTLLTNVIPAQITRKRGVGGPNAGAIRGFDTQRPIVSRTGQQA
jgi:hypothetical protein